MRNKVFSAINKYRMIEDNDTIVVGVSGGADSMALLHFLLNINDDIKIKVVAAHINHCLRGAESDRDERLVSEYCKKYGIDFHSCKIDVKSESNKNGTSVEECGRKIRYDYFSNIAKKYNAKIATAHTLSDSVETTIFNIIRGTGIRGLAGIPPVRDNIIRPLIFVTRSQVEDYCVKNKIEYITDSSNLSHDYTRNKIRLDIIPKMKSINSSLEKSFMRLKEQVEEENNYFDDITETALNKAKKEQGYDINFISDLAKPIKTKLIIKAVHDNCGIKLQKSHVDLICEIIENKCGTVTIPSKVYVKADKGYLKIFKPKDKRGNWQNKFNCGRILTESGRTFIIKSVGKDEYLFLKENDKNLFYKSLDYDKISKGAIFRNRKPGDKFSPINRGITKSLKKLFNEKKIPVEKRDDLAILENNNEILWIEGIGPSEKAAVNKNTENVVIILTGECKYD